MLRLKTIKWFLLIIGILILTTAAYALAGANIVPVSKAGDGSGVISGYTVSAIHYILNAVPTTIDSVTFTLDTAPVPGGTIKIKLVNAGSTWYNSCTNTGVNVTCVTTGASVTSANELRVVVAD